LDLVIGYLRSIKARMRVYRNNRLLSNFLNSFNNSDEFLEIIRKKLEKEKRYHTYLSPTGSRDITRNSFKSLYEALNIDFKNISFLDLGPGYGE